MPGSCPFINVKGEVCGKGFAAGNSHCAHHRARPAPKPSRPCASCGRPTKRIQGLCINKACGWNAYRRELAARKKAAAEAAIQRAAEHTAADAAAEEAAEELVAALEGLRPWPEWIGMTADEFEAAGVREAEAHRREVEAAAALAEALRVAEAEAIVAADRDRAAREQLDRLRRAYAATQLGLPPSAGTVIAH